MDTGKFAELRAQLDALRAQNAELRTNTKNCLDVAAKDIAKLKESVLDANTMLMEADSLLKRAATEIEESRAVLTQIASLVRDHLEKHHALPK